MTTGRWRTVYWNRRAEPESDEVVELDVAVLDGAAGDEAPRETVVVPDGRLLRLPEPGRLEATCVDADGRRIASFTLPDEGFAASSGLRWTITSGRRSDADAARLRLRARIDDLRSRFGEFDREVWLLEDAYVRHFCCNVCSEELRDSFVRVPDGGYEGVVDRGRLSDGVEYPCFDCGSRVRQRTARIVLDRDVRARRGRALLVSTDSRDRQWLARRFRPITHVALHGDFGDPDILRGTDITDMPHVESDAYDLMYAMNVLDYVPDLDAAAREAYRVLRSGGELAFFVMPYRLVDGDAGCVVEHRNALAHEAYARREDGAETGIPSCVFGVGHVLRTFRRAGFLIDAIPVLDPLSRTRQRWFVARKPVPPPPWRSLCAPARGVARVG